MTNTSQIAFGLAVGFLVFITVRGELPAYLCVLGIGGSKCPPANTTPLTTTSTTSVPTNSTSAPTNSTSANSSNSGYSNLSIGSPGQDAIALPPLTIGGTSGLNPIIGEDGTDSGTSVTSTITYQLPDGGTISDPGQAEGGSNTGDLYLVDGSGDLQDLSTI